MATVRKHFPKNKEGQIISEDYEKVREEVMKLVTEYLKSFPEWDIDDLMRALSLQGNWAATLVLLEEHQELYENGIDTKEARDSGD